MPKLVVHGATLQCTQGLSPATLSITGVETHDDDSGVATILHNVPTSNIGAFGMCKSLTNPQVASASSAAQGVLTPQPCVPVVVAPWSAGASVVSVAGEPALTSDSTCACSWAGTISVADPASAIDVD